MITSLDDLDRAVGPRPKTAMLKSIDHLDEHCRRFLEHSPAIAVATFATRPFASGAGAAVSLQILGGPAGFARCDGRSRLAFGGATLADHGRPAAALALVPGYGETLRVNGTVADTDADAIAVDEAFLHCAKAIIRSTLWARAEGGADRDGHGVSDGSTWQQVLAASPFILVASTDGTGNGDVSPKGDPAGFVRVLDDDRILIPDRPGNHRTDTFHNVLEDDHVAVLALVPGTSVVAELRGRAHVTADQRLLADSTVNGKTPKAGLVVQVAHAAVRHEPGLALGDVWNPATRVPAGTLPRASCIWSDHVRLNEHTPRVARVAMKLLPERMMAAGLDRDYQRNLY